jgi:NitT/TauT family transport system substrate-binding protein
MRLEFGVPTDKSAAEVRLGIEKGFFRDEGIDLSVRIVFGGPPLAAAYDRGELVFGEIGSPPAINAIAAGARFRIIGSGTRQKAHMYLGVRPAIRSFAELKGQRIGLLSIGSCPDWFLRRILAVEGLDPARDVTFVPLLEDYPRVIDLIKEGRIDACLATEPAISEGEAKGLINVWRAVYEARYVPDFQWVVVVANTNFITQEPALIQAALRALRRSNHYALAHVDEFADVIARHNRIEPDIARRSIVRELSHLHPETSLDRAGLEKAIDLQFALGGIPVRLGIEAFTDRAFA